MTNYRFTIFVTIILLLIGQVLCGSEVSNSGATPLYDTFEVTLDVDGVDGNKFTHFASFTFEKGGANYQVDGFYDGNNTWRARFSPNEEGVWSYSWNFQGKSGNGTFDCTPKTNSKIFGPVSVDGQFLRFDDGTPYHVYGGKWFHATNYGPQFKNGATNTTNNHIGYYSDSRILSYLNTAEQYGINTLLMKTSLFPLEDDGWSWDLDWVRRGEWLVREMAKRGIYCQVSCFDTWSRAKGTIFGPSGTKGNGHVLNAWSTQRRDAKENYIRYRIARLGGYSTVYWELGNEVDSDIRNPGPWSVFVSEANNYYMPWHHQYDPYQRPVGLSCIRNRNFDDISLDMDFPHKDEAAQFLRTSGRPMIQNEPCNRDGLDCFDSVQRDSKIGQVIVPRHGICLCGEDLAHFKQLG